MRVRRLLVAGVAVLAVGASSPVALADYPPATETVAPPDTSGCPRKAAPAPAVDTSEDLPPGVAAPAPLPVPADPVGGPRLGDCGFVLPDGAPAVPSDITASAWMVSDLTTGQVLGGKDVHGRYRPASTLKLLTMLVIWRNVADFNQQVIGTENDANQEGSRVGMGPGGVYTVNDLVLGLIMNSGNDCANALARVNGGWDKTIADMNAAAAGLGALDTRAATVSGLDGPGQQTSAYDLALITQADVLLPRFLQVLGTDVAMFPGFGEFPPFGMANDNKLLGNYPGALGGKTGFTDDSGNTFVGIAERNGHRLAVTMLGGTPQPRRQWMQGASLLDWGFAVQAAALAPVGTLVGGAADAASTASSTAASPSTGAGSAPTTGDGAAMAAGSGADSAAGAPLDAAASPTAASTGWLWGGLALLAAAAGLVAVLIRRRRSGAAHISAVGDDPDQTGDAAQPADGEPADQQPADEQTADVDGSSEVADPVESEQPAIRP